MSFIQEYGKKYLEVTAITSGEQNLRQSEGGIGTTAFHDKPYRISTLVCVILG